MAIVGINIQTDTGSGFTDAAVTANEGSTADIKVYAVTDSATSVEVTSEAIYQYNYSSSSGSSSDAVLSLGGTTLNFLKPGVALLQATYTNTDGTFTDTLEITVNGQIAVTPDVGQAGYVDGVTSAKLVEVTPIPDTSDTNPWSCTGLSWSIQKSTSDVEDLSAEEPVTLAVIAGKFDANGAWETSNQIVLAQPIIANPVSGGFETGSATPANGSVELDFSGLTGPFFVGLFVDSTKVTGWIKNRKFSLSTFLKRDLT